MPSKMILLLGVPMFVGCCTILWIYWDRFKKLRDPHKKKIFISADCWLSVFDLLPPSQLGLGISMISHRFDVYVDEHFKTRKWKLGQIEIRRKIGENGSKEMEIVTYSNGKALPIPQNPLPNKVIGFTRIDIDFIDHNVLTFLRRFHRFFATCATNLAITTENVRISEFVMLNILPMLKDSIRLMNLNTVSFRQMRQLTPSMLNDCQSLHHLYFNDNGISLAFPPDDSANASDGQAVAKWLFSPRPDNLPKKLFVKIENSTLDHQWTEIVEQIKAAFSIASSLVSFIILFHVTTSLSNFVLFELTNELTGEKLTLSPEANNFRLIRCPIVPKNKQQKIVKLVERWNRIHFSIGGVDEGLLNAASAGPSGDQKQQK